MFFVFSVKCNASYPFYCYIISDDDDDEEEDIQWRITSEMCFGFSFFVVQCSMLSSPLHHYTHRPYIEIFHAHLEEEMMKQIEKRKHSQGFFLVDQ